MSPRLRARLITAAALAGGVTAADGVTSAAFPVDDEEKRRHAALEGLKRGAIYGGVLAASEPVLHSLLKRAKRHFEDRRELVEFRALTHEEDTRTQRRKLATYAGGALAGAAGLAWLAKRPAGGPAKASAAPAIRPAGRGTMERQIVAGQIRDLRGYVHLRPMLPGQEKRFLKLPPNIKTKVSQYARLTKNVNLSPGERQKFRQAIGRLRGLHNFSAFVKDIAFKELPAETRKNIRAFLPAIKDDTLLPHYGMVTKELALKADPHNLSAARRSTGERTSEACAKEVYKRRETKHILVNNDRVVDGHHFIAKAERGKVSGSLHVIDLTPARFQMERKLRGASFQLARQLTKSPHEFMYADPGSMPVSQVLPPWVEQRRKNKKRREHIRDAADVAGLTVGTAGVAELVHKLIKARRKVGRIALGRRSARPTIYFRQQLRNADDDRFSNPYAVATGQAHAYYKRGNTRVDVSNLPVAHAQVLRKVFADAGKLRRTGGKVAGLLHDAADVVAGRERRTDYAGRPQKREWEKSWFKKAATDAAIGAAGVGLLAHLKSNPAHLHAVTNAIRKGRRKVNSVIPDFYAEVGVQMPQVRNLSSDRRPLLSEFTAMPTKFGGKIDYATQDAVYTLARALRKQIRGGKVSHDYTMRISPPRSWPTNVKSKSKLFSDRRPLTSFDEIADLVGWDVRDPRGRSARVFAPGSRTRSRRPKEWHEKVDNQRKLLAALAVAGTLAGAAGGAFAGRHFPLKPKPAAAIGKVIKFPKRA